MQLFYAFETDGVHAFFSSEESNHCIRVLRMRKGDLITFTDGVGNIYDAEITSDDHNHMEASVTKHHDWTGKRNYYLHMAVSPLKNNDRFEWFIEKAVEIGVDEITPLICARTEKTRIRKDRLEGLIISAMKQSVKAYLPKLNDGVNYNEFISASHNETKIIAHCINDLKRSRLCDVISRGEKVLILIGPEGDFTPEEVSMASGNGFLPVHLGESRLRTETAGVTACCSVYLTNS